LNIYQIKNYNEQWHSEMTKDKCAKKK